MKRFTCATTLLLAAVLFCLPAAADTLYLRDGEQLPGNLTRMSADAVWFETSEGVREFPKSDVLKIQLQRARKYDDVGTVDQITDPDLKACLENLPAREEFPAAGYVTLLQRQTFDLTRDGVMTETVRRIALILHQRGQDVATTNVWYFEDSDAPRVDFALTVAPDGRVLHLSDAALKSENIYSRLPEYQRLMRLRFACKEPRPGSVIDVQYTVERRRGGPLQPVYDASVFRGQEPILRKEVVVAVPQGAADKVMSQLTGDGAVQAARTEADGAVRLTWTLTGAQRGLPSEPLMPPLQSFAPTLTLGEKTSWEDVGQAYAQELAKLPPLNDALAQRARDLAEAGGAEAIRNHVARNVRTVPVPHWRFRVVPHDPNETARRGVANELDKNTLYWSMLQAAGIDAGLALVRSREAGPLAQDVPSLRAFNRSAVYVVPARRFTSAASDVLSFDALPGALQEAPAMVFADRGGELRTTGQPAPNDEADATRFEATLAEDGTLDLSVTYTAVGNAQAAYRGLKDLDEQQLRNRLTQFAAFLHPAAVLEDYDVSDLADLTVPPSLTMHVRIPGYAVKAGEDLMMLTLPAVSYSAHQVGRPEREFGLFWNHVAMETTTGRIALPEGYNVYSLPEEVDFSSDAAAYRASISAQDGAVAFDDAYRLKVDHAPASAYADYKKCLELRAGVPRQRIILSRAPQE